MLESYAMNGKIEKVLKDKTVIHLDTAPIIYFIQENPKYSPILKEVFSKIDQGYVSGISSFITLIELLVNPLELKNYLLADRYRYLVMNSSCFTLYPVERMVSEKAAELRAKYSGNTTQGFKLKTPDAIQIASAISFGAQLFLTNDDKLKNVKEIEVLTLDDAL